MSQEAGLPRRDPLVIVTAGVLSSFLWLAVVGQFVFFVPRATRAFAEFRMKLPMVTELVLTTSLWVIPIMTIATFAVCLVMGKRSIWPWAFLLILWPLIINVIVGVGIGYPYMQLLDGLQGGKK